MRILKKVFVSVALLSAVQVLADSKPLCTGDRVISDKGLIGTVATVFEDGEVSVQFDGYSGFDRWPTDRLAQTKGCSAKGYCVDRQVVSDKGLRGTISGIFPDGQVAVQFDGYSGYNQWPIRRLAKSEGCTRDNYCVGQRVVSDKGLAGTISGVFPDNQVAVQFDGYSGYNQWPTDRLAMTNACTDVPSCLHHMSYITNSDQQGRLLEAKISTAQIKSGSAEAVSGEEQKAPASSVAGTAI